MCAPQSCPIATVNVLFPPAPLPPALPLPPVDITMGDTAALDALDPDGMDPTLRKKRETHDFRSELRFLIRSFVPFCVVN